MIIKRGDKVKDKAGNVLTVIGRDATSLLVQDSAGHQFAGLREAFIPISAYASMKKIIKITIAFNPTGLKQVKGAHWDAYIWFQDGTRDALYSISKKDALELVEKLEI